MPRKKNPPQRDSVKEAYNDFTAYLETMRDEFRSFGEQLDFIAEKTAKIEQRVDAVEQQLGRIEVDIAFMRDELRVIRIALKEKVTTEELHALERRVAKIERQLART